MNASNLGLLTVRDDDCREFNAMNLAALCDELEGKNR